MRNLEHLRKFVCPEIVFGAHCHELAGTHAANFGLRRVLLATDAGLIKSGWVEQVAAHLASAGLEYCVFSAISPNPRETEVMAGTEFCRAEGCDGIVALGGGSVIDCAKGIAIALSNGQHVLEFEGVDNVAVPMPPLICIPTTAGTSADVSQFAIINHTARRSKIAIISKAVVPDVALIDPVTLTTKDPYLTACTGMDALVHAIEAYVSTAHSPLTDLHALAGIRLMNEHLVATVRDGQNLDLRTQTMLGSLEAGLAFSNASLGAVHALAHSLGGRLDLPHGECNALLLEHVVADNFNAAADRYRTIAEVMHLPTGGDDADVCARLVAHIRALRTDAGIGGALRDRKVQAGDIRALAENAVNDPCLITNPRRASIDDICTIYAAAL